MAEQRLMKYNPAFLSDEELIATFTVRERELDSILEVVRENTDRSNQHVLVIGPRGIGKTTLVRRVAAEVRRDSQLKAQWQPLVYAEESYRVCSPGEFWLEGILHLAEQTKDPQWMKSYEELLEEKEEQRLREKALGRLLDYADGQGKRILLIVENLNMLFQDQMDKDAGWVLRQTLQHEDRIMLLGTANKRFAEIKGVDRAWFEMFKFFELSPLSPRECGKVWRKITGEQLKLGRSRMYRILTGGNPRLLAIFIQFAQRLSLKELMDDLVRLVDEHTEYFKSHLDSLPGLERKVFVSLAEIWDPATANEVAGAARLEVSKTSAYLNRLIERGAVEAISVRGKRKKYQLVERMYNIYYLMRCRSSSSSRVQAAAQFMISWYTPDEIGRVVNCLGMEAYGLTSEGRREFYQVCESLLEKLKKGKDKDKVLESIPEKLFRFPDFQRKIHELRSKHISKTKKTKIQHLVDKYVECFQNRNFQAAEAISHNMIDEDQKSQELWYLYGFALAQNNKHEEAERALRKAISFDSQFAPAWKLLGDILKDMGKFKVAEKTYRRAIEIDPSDAMWWEKLGRLLYQNLGKYDEAEEIYRKVIMIDPRDDWTWNHLGILLHFKLGRTEEAEKAYLEAMKINPRNYLSWFCLGFVFLDYKKYKEAEDAFRKSIEIEPNINEGREFLIQFLLKREKEKKAIEEAERGLMILARSANFLEKIAEIFGLDKNKQYLEKAEAWSREAVEKAPGEMKYKFTLARILGRKGVWLEALELMKAVMEDVELAMEQMKPVTDFYIDAAAAGYAKEGLKVLNASASADQYEPLSAGLERFITGRRGLKAKEIEEVAEDVLERIVKRQKEMKKGGDEKGLKERRIPNTSSGANQ